MRSSVIPGRGRHGVAQVTVSTGILCYVNEQVTAPTGILCYINESRAPPTTEALTLSGGRGNCQTRERVVERALSAGANGMRLWAPYLRKGMQGLLRFQTALEICATD